MKMFLKSMMALLALVFVMGSYDAQAQCPPGTGSCTWNTVTITKPIVVDNTTIPVTTCIMEISFCYRTCAGNCEVFLSGVKFDLSCMNGINFGSSFIQDQIALEVVKNTPCALTASPCDNPQPVATYKLAACYAGTVKEKSPILVRDNGNTSKPQTKNKNAKGEVELLGGTSPNDFYVEIVACESLDIKCETVYKSCIDYSVNPPVIQFTKWYSQSFPVDECSKSPNWVIHEEWYLIPNYNTGCMPLCN